jgi:hypothetical protein
MATAPLSLWMKRFLGMFQVSGKAPRRTPRRSKRALLLELLEARDCPSASFTSGNNSTFLAGSPGAFSITTAGAANPTISENGNLPSGVLFHDNGNGTAVLGGTPILGTGGVYQLTLTDDDGAGSVATQAFTLIVDQAPSITSASSTAFAIGVSNSFTVTTGQDFPTDVLTESGSLPSGVTFVDNGNGTASLSGTPAAGTAGTYPMTITASNGVGSDATQSFSLTIGVGSVTHLAMTPLAPTFGRPLILTATVGPATGTATLTGTVSFYDGNTQLGSPVTVSGDRASISTSALGAGSHSFTAVYSGGGSYLGSSSQPLNANISASNTRVLLSPSSIAPVYGQPLTLTARVSPLTPGTMTPTGTVTFMDGTTVLGTANTTNGVATLPGQILSVGAHALTASFHSSSANDSDSTSSIYHESVRAARAVITLSATPTPDVYGEQVTLTAHVTVLAPGSADPNGTITFKDALNVLGTAPVVNGIATLTTSSLSAGTHLLFATYGGDTNTTTGVGVVRLAVARASTSVDMSSSPTDSLATQTVTLTANVGVTLPGVSNPTGYVAFYRGAALIGTGVVNNGVATFTTQRINAVGTYLFTGVYRGDSHSAPSSTTWTVTVHPVGTDASTMTLTSNGSPSTSGSPVTFTATVDAVDPANGTPVGTVTFLDSGKLIGTAALSGDSASVVAKFLGNGPHSITANYSGDINFSTNTASMTQVVQVGTTTTLALSIPAPVFGQPETITARVNPVAVSSAAPTGFVVFMDGSTQIGQANLVNGVATLPNQTLAVGAHSLTGVFHSTSVLDGDSTSLPITENVGQARTTVAFSASPLTSVYGQSVTLTATVAVSAPGVATAGGTVTFKDGLTVLGSAPVVNGVATYTSSSFTVGTHTFTLSYAGDTDTANSSNIGRFTVAAAGTTTDMSSSPHYGVAGHSVTLTANVAVVAPGSAAPSGVVAFYQAGVQIGTGTINNGVASFTTQAIAAGTYAFTAQYRGDSHCQTSTSASWSIQMVSPPVISDLSLASANPLDASGTVSLSGGGVVVANVTGSDPQNLPVTYTYVWKVNNITVRVDSNQSATSDQLTLASVGASVNDVVTVTVTPNNGVLDGSSVTSSPVTVTA